MKQIQVQYGKIVSLEVLKTSSDSSQQIEGYCNIFEIFETSYWNNAKIVSVNLCTSSNFTYNASSNEVYLRFYKNKIKPETRFRVIWQAKDPIEKSSSNTNNYSRWTVTYLFIIIQTTRMLFDFYE